MPGSYVQPQPPCTIVARGTSSEFTFTVPRIDMMDKPFWMQIKGIILEGVVTAAPAIFTCTLGIQSSYDTSVTGPGPVVGCVTNITDVDAYCWPSLFCHQRTAQSMATFKVLDSDGAAWPNGEITGVVVIFQITSAAHKY